MMSCSGITQYQRGVGSTHADKHTHTPSLLSLAHTHAHLDIPPVVGSPSAASVDRAGHLCRANCEDAYGLAVYCEDVYGVSCLVRYPYVCCWGEACQWLHRVEFSSTACGACQPLQDRWVHDPNARCTCEERYHCESAVACTVHLGVDVACPVHGYAAVSL
jgi:hypothetical protein